MLPKNPKPIIRDHLFRAEITSLQIRWTEELKREARLGLMNIHKEHSNSVAKPGTESSSTKQQSLTRSYCH